MEKIFTWEFWKRVLVRAFHTMAQTALGMITVGAAIKDVDWLYILSVSAVAGIASVLKSIVVSVPEYDNELNEVEVEDEHLMLDEDSIEEIEDANKR